MYPMYRESSTEERNMMETAQKRPVSEGSKQGGERGITQHRPRSRSRSIYAGSLSLRGSVTFIQRVAPFWATYSSMSPLE